MLRPMMCAICCMRYAVCCLLYAVCCVMADTDVSTDCGPHCSTFSNTRRPRAERNAAPYDAKCTMYAVGRCDRYRMRPLPAVLAAPLPPTTIRHAIQPKNNVMRHAAPNGDDGRCMRCNQHQLRSRTPDLTSSLILMVHLPDTRPSNLDLPSCPHSPPLPQPSSSYSLPSFTLTRTPSALELPVPILGLLILFVVTLGLGRPALALRPRRTRT